MQELVTYEVRDDVAFLGLNRAEKRNAASRALIDALEAGIARAEQDARVGVIFGHGAHFCAGLDLNEIETSSSEAAIAGSRRWHAVFDVIARGRIPFVAAIAGAAIGGGLELAAAAHLRVADETAFFALPEGQRGIFIGGGGSVRITRLISAAKVTDLLLTGRVMNAAEAEAANLVQYRVPEGEALQKATELAAKIATNAQMSNFAVIQALPRIQDMSHDDGLFVESLVATLAQTSQEAGGRVESFLAKKTPRILPTDEQS